MTGYRPYWDEVVYVGRTNNIPLRRYAHSIDPKRKDYDMPDDKIHSGLTKAEQDS